MSGISVHNGRIVSLSDVPLLSPDAFHKWVIDSVARGARIASMFGAEIETNAPEIIAALANDTSGKILLARTSVNRASVLTGNSQVKIMAGRDARPTQQFSFESLTNELPQAQLFEREIAEQFGIRVIGHPWLKPVRLHHSDFFQVTGEEVHEVAVGPVHAGVIEPGHFRFQCHGETVFHLEIALGYQHRGIERALQGGPHLRTVHQMETVAGDTTIGHALAYCQVLEAFSGIQAPARAQVIRGIVLELERLANHVGDLGALAGDVAYLPTASFCGRLRGDFLNMTAAICGSRFGRGLIRPAGVAFDLTPQQVLSLQQKLNDAFRDVKEAVESLWETPTVVERFVNTGRVSMEDAEAIGLVGPAARACGMTRDVRHDHPTGIFRFAHVPVMTAHNGDVNSRALVRWLEIQQSVQFILHQLSTLPQTSIRNDGPRTLKPSSVAVSLVEGWRGEICHVAITDPSGRFLRYKITDPSFHNWFGLALALRDGQISDFPLCNKSFNLSYCGHDL
jgi:Ni,Fe-hydrogenase III large subunit